MLLHELGTDEYAGLSPTIAVCEGLLPPARRRRGRYAGDAFFVAFPASARALAARGGSAGEAEAG